MNVWNVCFCTGFKACYSCVNNKIQHIHTFHVFLSYLSTSHVGLYKGVSLEGALGCPSPHADKMANWLSSSSAVTLPLGKFSTSKCRQCFVSLSLSCWYLRLSFLSINAWSSIISAGSSSCFHSFWRSFHKRSELYCGP